MDCASQTWLFEPVCDRADPVDDYGSGTIPDTTNASETPPTPDPTAEHFLFRCKNWTAQREILLKCTRTKIGNLSFFLGGKAASDDDRWELDMQAVRATIRFTIATKRLESTGVTQGVDL